MELVMFDGPDGAEKSAILEMRQLDTVANFTVTKDKMQLPKDGNSNKGMFIPFLNTKPLSIAKILTNKHLKIMNQGTAYKGYYYDHIRLFHAIKSPRVKNPGISKMGLKQQRIIAYGVVQEAAPNIITPITPTTLAGKNFVYDMEPLTDLMKRQRNLEKMPLVERLKMYFNTIGSFYDGLVFDKYKKAPIFIDLDDFHTEASLNDFQFYDYMMVLLRKSDNLIFKIMMSVPEMEVVLYTTKGYVKINTLEDFKRENFTHLVRFVKRIQPVGYDAKGANGDKYMVSDITDYYEGIVKADLDNQIKAVITKNATGPQDFDDTVKDAPTIAADITIQKLEKKISAVKDIEADEDEAKKEEKKRLKEESSHPETEFRDEEDKDVSTKISEEEAIEDTIEEIENDEELKTSFIKSVTDKRAGSKTAASLKRDKMLREKQMTLKIHDKKIGDLIADIPEPPKIPEHQISKDMIVTDNTELTNVRFYNFESAYIEEMFDRDMARAITSFNDKGINVNVTNVKVEDTSTELVYQDTYTIELEDENRKRHTIKANIPKLVDDKFLIINGKRRVIEKQLVGLPVIKTGPDELQIVSNYNKIWMTRRGTRFNPNMERFKKMILDDTKRPDNMKVRVYKGDNSVINRPYLTCLEYDELASKYNKIVINDCTFVFSVDMLKEELGDKYKDSTLEEIIIGYKGTKKEPIIYNTTNSEHQDMVSLMVQESIPVYYDTFKKLSSGRKYVHNNVKMLEKDFPLVFAVTFFEGLTTVVQKFNNLAGGNRVEFVDKKDNSDNYMYIQFADGYLKYAMNDLEACLLFNGFTELVLKDFTFAEMDNRDTYITIFEQLLGSGYYAGGFINFYDFMIDFKTLDILKLLGYPEDIVSLMIFASNMLADSSFSIDTDPTLYRLRNVEIIPAILYKEMTKAYSRYRKTANNANPTKLSLDPDCVIKELNGLPTVDSYSRLSPIVEVKQFGVTSMKGYVGMNKDRSYSEEKRNYHDNMIGLIGVSTDISGNCGKERHLVVEPNVLNAYGMLDVIGRENAKDLDATKLMTTEEMTYPMGVAHDDPNRTAMTSKQSCHAIPVQDQCPCLITNGFDSTIQYRTSNDFSFVAKQDGEVIDRNDDTNIMIIKYADGTIQAIDLDNKIVQNGGGGFYLGNKLDSTFKKGDRFKKDAILAFDKHYFKDTGVLGNKLTYGTLVKTACLSNMATYEDSMWSTYRLSRAMSADITMKEISIVIGKNSNVDYICKVGDRVKNGEDLIRYDTSYTDAEMSELMNSIRKDLQEEVINLGRSKYTSKHDGIVADIRVYPAVELDELSPSLKKMVNNIQKHERDRRTYMDKFDKNKNSVYRSGIFFDRTVGKVETDQYGKIAGVDVHDGVLLEIYVTYHDEVSDGDKFAHMSANKATNGYMVPRGFEPYTAFRPYEEIDIPLAPSAILQRGTPSVITVEVGYKVLIELKRKCFEILTGKDWNEKMKEERPYMNVHTKKPITPTKESSMYSGFNEDKIKLAKEHLTLMESAFDIMMSSDNKYEASQEYSKGDIVFAGMNFMDEVNRAVFEQNLSKSSEGFIPNIELDEGLNAYVAKDVIYYGERLVL